MKKIKLSIGGSIEVEGFIKTPEVIATIPKDMSGYAAIDWLRENDPEQVSEIMDYLRKVRNVREKLRQIIKEEGLDPHGYYDYDEDEDLEEDDLIENEYQIHFEEI